MVSPVSHDAILDHSIDALKTHHETDHQLRRRRRSPDHHNDEVTSQILLYQCNDSIMVNFTDILQFHYNFEMSNDGHDHHSSAAASDFNEAYLTTKVYKRRTFKLPTAGRLHFSADCMSFDNNNSLTIAIATIVYLNLIKL